MIKLNKIEKILVIAAGLLLMMFVLKIFVLGPVYEKTAVYNSEIEQSQMAMRKYLALEQNRPEILKAQKQIEGYSSLKGSDEEKAAIVMSKIESEARASKLQILDMNPAGVVKVKGGMTLYQISLRAEGQLKDVINFISAIEGEKILLQVEKIAIAAKDETASALKIDVTILGVSF